VLILNLTSCHLFELRYLCTLKIQMEKIIEESKQGESLVLENKPENTKNYL
jgi:hypothetical protein